MKTRMTENGTVVLSREEYDRLDRTNFSALKHMARSPAHYLAAKKEPRDSASMKRGRAVHIACLEPHKFKDEVVVFDGDRRAGKAWEAFEAAHASKEILTAKEYAVVEASACAVRTSPLAMKYLQDGQAEQTILWEHMGFQLKARLDWISPLALADLKSTKDASLDGFGREVMTYQTLPQCAWYRDAHEFVTGERRPFVLIPVEATYPHAVQVYKISEAQLELGRFVYRGWLEKLARCLESNAWPGYSETEVDLILPSWAFREEAA